MTTPLVVRWLVPPPVSQWLGAPQQPGPIATIVGPRGLTGDPTARYVHTQSSPSATWTVNHNLDNQVVVASVRSPGGVEVTADILFVSLNQLQIFFATPCTGTVIVQ